MTSGWDKYRASLALVSIIFQLFGGTCLGLLFALFRAAGPKNGIAFHLYLVQAVISCKRV